MTVTRRGSSKPKLSAWEKFKQTSEYKKDMQGLQYDVDKLTDNLSSRIARKVLEVIDAGKVFHTTINKRQMESLIKCEEITIPRKGVTLCLRTSYDAVQDLREKAEKLEKSCLEKTVQLKSSYRKVLLDLQKETEHLLPPSRCIQCARAKKAESTNYCKDCLPTMRYFDLGLPLGKQPRPKPKRRITAVMSASNKRRR